MSFHVEAGWFELGPRRRPNEATLLTNRCLYWRRRLARPVFFLCFSCLATWIIQMLNYFFCCWLDIFFYFTFGVCPLTLPARANEPWTLPPNNLTVASSVEPATRPNCSTVCSSFNGVPLKLNTSSSISISNSSETYS
jgi:hypothetical protein